MWIAGGSVCMISSIITFIVSYIGYTHAHRKEIAEAACMEIIGSNIYSHVLNRHALMAARRL